MEKFMEQQRNRQTLKIFSMLFIFLALIDIMKAIFEATKGGFNPENIAYGYNVSKEIALTMVIISLILIVVIFTIEMFLGIRGLQSAESNVYIGKAHIILAKIVLVPVVFTLILQVIALINNITAASFTDWLDLSTPLASTIIVFSYISAAKKVNAEK